MVLVARLSGNMLWIHNISTPLQFLCKNQVWGYLISTKLPSQIFYFRALGLILPPQAKLYACGSCPTPSEDPGKVAPPCVISIPFLSTAPIGHWMIYRVQFHFCEQLNGGLDMRGEFGIHCEHMLFPGHSRLSVRGTLWGPEQGWIRLAFGLELASNLGISKATL